MGDIVGRSLGAMSLGPSLNQSGVDHVSQGLSSPFHDFMVKGLLRNYVMNQWNVGNKSIDGGNLSLSNITDSTFAGAPEEDSLDIPILVLSLILAGLIVASIVLFVILLKDDNVLLKTKVLKFKYQSKQPDQQGEPTVLRNEENVALYSTIFLDEADPNAEQEHLADDTSGSCDSGIHSEYSRLKRNYGNRLNSDENGSENTYDKVVVHTQSVNRLSSQASDDYTPECTSSSTVYVIREFPEVF